MGNGRPLKIVLLLPDGTGVRNFLGTRFLELALARGSVVVWHALRDSARELDEWRSERDGLSWHALPPYHERRLTRVLRLAKFRAQLYRDREIGGQLFLDRLRPRGFTRDALRSRALSLVTHGIGAAQASDRGVHRLDELHARFGESERNQRDYEAFLLRERPDVVFCAHQRSPRAVPALLAARNLGIPTATFVYSWDNLPMGRMAVQADHYMLWSETMRRELLTIYPDIAADRTHVVGTPQFEPYFHAPRQAREEFLGSVGLDPARPVVCFSGDDSTVSPHDELYLADLAEALRGVPAARRPQLLFRRCPVDPGTRYAAVLQAYPEIGVSAPLWVAVAENDWSQVLPTRGDPARLANVVRHSDLVVNIGSTMALDFAILDKPAIYLNYVHPDRPGWKIANVYREPHFARVHRLQPVHWVNRREELAAVVLQALQHPEEKSAARRAWIEDTAQVPLDQASVRLSDALASIARVAG